MIRFGNKNQCSGCTACANSCPHQAIWMQPDRLGFCYPIVDTTLCTDCGICEAVCPFHPSAEDIDLPLPYAVRHKDMQQVAASQSGAAFIALSDWVLEQGGEAKVVELVVREGKTYVRVNDYVQLRALFGKLLAEVQRIKSEGDYEAARRLVEAYGVQIDPALHAEVLQRYERLHLAPYKGFVNPVYTLQTDAEGNVTDVQIAYTEGYAEQMLRYSREYSNL